MSFDTVTVRGGFQILKPTLSARARMFLRMIFALNPSLRESILFRESRLSFSLQKFVQRPLGGAQRAQIRYTEGAAAGNVFECDTSEKYFMLGSHFEHEIIAALRGVVKPGDVVYDVGSHAGYMALSLSRLCEPNGRVYAFEPSQINFQRLSRHVALNDKSGITLVNMAASDVEGSARLAEDGSFSYILSESNLPDMATCEIRTIRLDDYVYRDQGAPPGVVKIDVEGHAGRALAGMRGILSKLRPKLICELHDSKESHDVLSILSEHSYAVSYLDREKGFPRRLVAKPI